MKTLLLALTALLTGCTTRPATTWFDAGPHNCPHTWVTWSRWQDQPIGTLAKQTRTRGCRVCNWAETQSRFAVTKK